MCRLLAYIGTPVNLESILCKPEHSLIVQSYKPREMLQGTVNADGYGIGWYDLKKGSEPFIYKSIIPIWNDTNLESISRYVESNNILAYIRSATSGQALDMSNAQPFKYKNLSFIHNGRVEKFKKTLYRPMRTNLTDEIYSWIGGTTDSEHIFAMILNHLTTNPDKTIEQALHVTLLELQEMAFSYDTSILANLVVSDGKRLVASRYAVKQQAPTLYWVQDDANFPNSVIIASEPLFTGNWQPCPENSIISVGEECDIELLQI
ncbi:class II glutamine amidotransferase [Dulcicalothrix desertica PCC 7102]|uniref:Class II glutamine amidotransferase n=1 Tax=Dulcicalothrix desertica PCC 7102 TaxID=232991 RepID=A0A3S1ASI5_9CYAN|nr:ergothioneine biosynthesis protein EgtC [Dulcicalothrix desertica]RUT07956.1 class II glutamine amidotransferase [Dulcicalothrix desertica PCC 7102]TWH39478.1 glutamine amidotransferase [Dulcicalothrix desertica PCC 7102]